VMPITTGSEPVSIRAPARGATAGDAGLFAELTCFDPRSRAGSDPPRYKCRKG
jgi:hypothetical protein